MTNGKNPKTISRSQKYEDYIKTFNLHDFEALKDFWTEDLYFYRGENVAPLVSRQAMMDFYEEAWKHFDECLTVRIVDEYGPYLSVEITNNLSVKNDWPDSPYGPFYKGQKKEVSGRVNYTYTRDGKIAVIVDAE